MRDFEQKSIRSYNEKADDYDDTRDGKFTLQFKQQLLHAVKIKNGDTVLDVGCGNGTLLKMLASQYDIEGKGIDIAEKMIENAKRKAPQMTFVAGKCEDIPFDSNTVDVITVCAAYHHFPDVQAFAQEAYRVLKGQGVIYIADLYYANIFRWIMNPFVPLLKDGDVRFYSPSEIIRTFHLAGFQVLDVSINGRVQIVSLQKV